MVEDEIEGNGGESIINDNDGEQHPNNASHINRPTVKFDISVESAPLSQSIKEDDVFKVGSGLGIDIND